MSPLSGAVSAGGLHGCDGMSRAVTGILGRFGIGWGIMADVAETHSARECTPPAPLGAAVVGGRACDCRPLVWWAIGTQDEPSGLDHDYGPYHLPLLLEQMAGVAAVAGTPLQRRRRCA